MKIEEVLRKMTTSKKSVCGANCICQDTKSELVLPLGQNDQASSLGKSEYTAETCCFHRKVECGRDCACNPELCRNRQMTMKQ